MESSIQDMDVPKETLVIPIAQFQVSTKEQSEIVKNANDGGEGSKKYVESIKKTQTDMNLIMKHIYLSPSPCFVQLEQQPGENKTYYTEAGAGLSCIMNYGKPDCEHSIAALKDPEVMKKVNAYYSDQKKDVPATMTTITITYQSNDHAWYQKVLIWSVNPKLIDMGGTLVIHDLMKWVIRKLWTSLKDLLMRLGIKDNVLEEIDKDLADKAVEDGIEIAGRRITLVLCEIASFCVTLIAFFAIFLGLGYILDNYVFVDYYNTFTIYNYTDQDLEFSVPYQSNVANKMDPEKKYTLQKAYGNQSFNIPGFQPRKLADGERIVYYASFDAQNSDTFLNGLASLVKLVNITENERRSPDLTNIIAEATIHSLKNNKTNILINMALKDNQDYQDLFDDLCISETEVRQILTAGKYQITLNFNKLGGDNYYTTVLNIVDTKLYPEMVV